MKLLRAMARPTLMGTRMGTLLQMDMDLILGWDPARSLQMVAPTAAPMAMLNLEQTDTPMVTETDMEMVTLSLEPRVVVCHPVASPASETSSLPKQFFFIHERKPFERTTTKLILNAKKENEEKK